MSATFLLAVSLLEVALAPVAARLARRSALLFAATDSFVATTVGALALVHILPHTWRVAGPSVLVVAAIGALLPVALHVAFHRLERRALPLLAWLVLGALAFHAVLDGAALATVDLSNAGPATADLAETERLDAEFATTHDSHHDHDHGSMSTLIGAAVVLHRFPMVLGIWWFALPLLGRRAAIALLTALGLGTLAGYFAADISWAALGSQPIALVQALVAGMLFHVLIGHEGPDDSRNTHGQRRWAIVAGCLLGLAVTMSMALLGTLELPAARPLSTLITAIATALVAIYVLQARWRQRHEHGHSHSHSHSH